MNAISFDFVLGDELVGAVFEDEAAGEVLGGRVRGQGKQQEGQEQCRQMEWPAW